MAEEQCVRIVKRVEDDNSVTIINTPGSSYLLIQRSAEEIEECVKQFMTLFNAVTDSPLISGVDEETDQPSARGILNSDKLHNMNFKDLRALLYANIDPELCATWSKALSNGETRHEASVVFNELLKTAPYNMLLFLRVVKIEEDFHRIGMQTVAMYPDHDHSKDDMYNFATNSFFAREQLKEVKDESVVNVDTLNKLRTRALDHKNNSDEDYLNTLCQSEIQYHYEKEAHHPQHNLIHPDKCVFDDVVEAAIDCMYRCCQFSGPDVTTEQITKIMLARTPVWSTVPGNVKQADFATLYNEVVDRCVSTVKNQVRTLTSAMKMSPRHLATFNTVKTYLCTP